MVLGPPPWPRTSALGDSTRRYSARSSKRAPSSKPTVKTSRSGLRRSSVGHGLAEGLSEGIALFIGQGARFAGKHHRHPAANGIGESSALGNQFLLLAVIQKKRYD